MAAVERPHIQYPFRRGVNGKVIVVEQGGPEHIMSCENVIVRCPTGWRDERPEFGWPFPTFKNAPLDVSALESALRTFEPRPSPVTVAEYADVASAAVRHMSVQVGVPSDG